MPHPHLPLRFNFTSYVWNFEHQCASGVGAPPLDTQLSGSFLALKLAWTSFTKPQQWWKLLSRSPLTPKQACTGYRKPFSPLRWSCESSSLQFECQKWLTKQFTPLWRSCVCLMSVSLSGGTLFLVQQVSKGFRSLFSPLWRSCEACVHQVEYPERSWNQVLPLLWSCEACAGQFGCQEKQFLRCWKQFSPQSWYCEACSCLFELQDGQALVHMFLCQEVPWGTLFEFQDGPTKHFSPLLRYLCIPVCESLYTLKSVFTIVEVLWSSYRPIWLSERIQNTFFTVVGAIWSYCTYVSVSGGNLKAGFTTVEVMWKFCTPVWVSWGTLKTVFTTVEV